MAESFDYIIVGAGPSAMGLVLGLVEPFLDQDLPFSIAIVERGPESLNDQRNLSRWFEASHDPSSSHVSILKTRLKETGRLVDAPVGQGIGGGSNINAGLCIPHLSDLEKWPEPWKTFLPASIQHLQDRLAANHCLWDGASGEEIMHSTKYSETQRLLFQGTKVTGVEMMDAEGKIRSIYAQKEVILCAGAIETPALLLVSAMGDDITIDGPLKGVGQGLRDHVLLPRSLLGPPPALSTTLNGVHRIASFAVEEDQFLLMTATSSPEIAVHFVARILHQYYFSLFSSANWLFQGIWTILEGLLRILLLYTPVFFLLKFGTTTMNLALLNPQSTGSVTLRPKLGADHPRRRKDFDIQLDLGYLRHPEDFNAFWRGWVASPVAACPQQTWWWELYPGGVFQALYNLCLSKKENSSSSAAPPWFLAFARDFNVPFFHWCGTCCMKTNDEDDFWVVDATARVRSLQSLRVCDASIFPNNLLVPPALTCAAIGHLLAGLLLKDRKIPSRETREH